MVSVATLGSAAEIRSGIQKTPARGRGLTPVRYLTVVHVHNNDIRLNDERFFQVTDEEFERWKLLPGDVLVVEGNGSPSQVGRCALYEGEPTRCVHHESGFAEIGIGTHLFFWQKRTFHFDRNHNYTYI